MTSKQNEIVKFLSKYKSSTEEQLIFFTQGTLQDINCLLSERLIVKDEKTKILYLRMKKLDVRAAVALDVIKAISKEIKEFYPSKKFPVMLTTITNENLVCDIAVVRGIEQEMVFKKIKEYSNADKLIVVLENDKYENSLINTTKEVLICKYPIQIIDKVN